MESQDYQTCPQCQQKVISLNSGKLICRACGWSDKKTEISPQTKLPSFSKNQFKISSISKIFFNSHNNLVGKFFFYLGLIMIISSSFYDTAVCERSEYSFSLSCTHNIGLLNEKSNLINIGGFLFIGGCILMTNIQDKSP